MKRVGNTQVCDCGRFAVDRFTMHHGRRYVAWDQYPALDWAPCIIKITDSAQSAWQSVERYLYPVLFEAVDSANRQT